MNSKVISARVPIDIAEMFETQAKAKGLTKSKMLQNIITNPPTLNVYKGGGEIVELPDELGPLLTAVGGVGIGLLIFKAVNNALDHNVYSENERMMIAGASALAGGMLTGKLLKEIFNPSR
jgi:hypothetical protein